MTPLLINILTGLVSFIIGAAYGYRKAIKRSNSQKDEAIKDLEKFKERVKKALEG